MVTKWFEGKTAALSFNFEGNDESLYNFGSSSLNERDWKATFFISTKTVNWDNVLSVFKAGHDIGNHSHSNRNLLSLTPNQVNQELLTSMSLLDQYLPKYKVLSFSYPFSNGIQPGSQFDSIRDLVSKYHICATSAGTTGGYLTMEKSIPYHGYRNKDFNNFYLQLGSAEVKSNWSLDKFNNEIEKTIESGNWLSLMYYSLSNIGREHVEQRVFRLMLNSVQDKEEDLWVAPLGEVAKYHMMRRRAKISYFRLEKNHWELRLTDDLDDDIYDHALTVQVMKPIDREVVKVVQGGKKIDFVENWNLLQFNLIPDIGSAYITYKSIKVD